MRARRWQQERAEEEGEEEEEGREEGEDDGTGGRKGRRMCDPADCEHVSGEALVSALQGGGRLRGIYFDTSASPPPSSAASSSFTHSDPLTS